MIDCTQEVLRTPSKTRTSSSEPAKYSGEPLVSSMRPILEKAVPIVPVPVVPVFPAWRTDQVVTVGTGGHLTLAFDHKVVDDPLNAFGVDLIIFGNSAQATSDKYWDNTDPAAFTVSGGASGEAGQVLVRRMTLVR